MAERPPQITPVIRVDVLKAYERDRPKAGHAYEAWCEEIADDRGITANQVKRIIGEECGSFLASLKQEQRSDSQNIADYIGATQAKALAVLNEAMEASEPQFLRDRHGDPVKDEDGKPIVIHKPLHGIRLKAAEHVLTVHGGWAPKEMHVEHTVRDESELSTEELAERYQRLLTEAHREFGIVVEGTLAGTGANQGGTPDAAGASGSLVLADRVHQDEGRAGSAQPV